MADFVFFACCGAIIILGAFLIDDLIRERQERKKDAEAEKMRKEKETVGDYIHGRIKK